VAISKAWWMKKPKPEPLDRARLRQAVIDLLSRRDYSRLELQRKLQPKAADADDLTAVLDDMAERRWQSDERFTDAFLHSRSDRYGPLRLTQELQQKGIADARTAVAALDTDWQERAAQLALRKFSGADLTDIKQKARIYRHLAQRGFNADHIRYALEQLAAAGDPHGSLSDDEISPGWD